MLQALGILAAIGFLVATFLQTQLLFAKAAGQRLAESYAVQAFARAQAFLLRETAATVALSGPAASLAPAAMPADCVSPSFCTLKITATYTLAGSTTQSGGSGATAQNVQTVDLANEQRTAVQVNVSVVDLSGNVIATRSLLGTLRTFAAPPYAMFDGIQDTAVDDAANAEPDTGGCDPLAAATCDPSAAGPFADTRLHAQQTCANDGNGQRCSGLAPTSIDTFASPAWTNGNAVAQGWSR